MSRSNANYRKTTSIALTGIRYQHLASITYCTHCQLFTIDSISSASADEGVWQGGEQGDPPDPGGGAGGGGGAAPAAAPPPPAGAGVRGSPGRGHPAQHQEQPRQ